MTVRVKAPMGTPKISIWEVREETAALSISAAERAEDSTETNSYAS